MSLEHVQDNQYPFLKYVVNVVKEVALSVGSHPLAILVEGSLENIAIPFQSPVQRLGKTDKLGPELITYKLEPELILKRGLEVVTKENIGSLRSVYLVFGTIMRDKSGIIQSSVTSVKELLLISYFNIPTNEEGTLIWEALRRGEFYDLAMLHPSEIENDKAMAELLKVNRRLLRDFIKGFQSYHSEGLN